MTKAERKLKAKKASAKRRVALALAQFLKRMNPGVKYESVGYRRTKNGYSIMAKRAAKKRK
jgi:hypothetical protein